jgi:hypothetical protein
MRTDETGDHPRPAVGRTTRRAERPAEQPRAPGNGTSIVPGVRVSARLQRFWGQFRRAGRPLPWTGNGTPLTGPVTGQSRDVAGRSAARQTSRTDASREAAVTRYPDNANSGFLKSPR